MKKNFPSSPFSSPLLLKNDLFFGHLNQRAPVNDSGSCKRAERLKIASGNPDIYINAHSKNFVSAIDTVLEMNITY